MSALLEGLLWVLSNLDVFRSVAEALESGTPKEAIQAAIRGAMLTVSEQALREEFEAADLRK